MTYAAAYCRVSTDTRDQANSFESQCRFFSQYIKEMPQWQLFDIYADEGVTGTSTEKRGQFNRMICDARDGKFQRIVTKEVSRFSRNILDTISFTRQLRQWGVGVLFLNDGIDTLEPDAELRLSILGCIAQEESRRTSQRVKWGQSRRMEQGVVFGRSMLGYDVKEGKMSINSEGAETVKKIFRLYGEACLSLQATADTLSAEKIKTFSGGAKWSAAQIYKILKNEKYIGKLVQKKTFTPDYLTHKKKYNHGEEELITVYDHHEPIITAEQWDKAQTRLQRKRKK